MGRAAARAGGRHAVLAMGCVGFAAAAFWLRYRAPVTDRRALGVAGRPVAAVAVALILVVAGAVTETVLPIGLWLAALVGLDAVALVLLRTAVHVGLLEEAGEQPIGHPIRCANCRARTPRHTFCANCGIALRALPNVRTAEERADRVWEGRLDRLGAGRGRLVAGVLVVAVAAAVGTAAVGIVAPGTRQPRCRRGAQCGAPPAAPRAVTALLAGYTAWRSAGLGYSLRYITGQWHVTGQSADDVVLQGSDAVSQIAVHGVSATMAGGLPRLLAARRAALAGSLLGLAADTDPDDQILGPNVGLVPGAAAVYRATANLPQAPGAPVSVVLLAARAGTVALVVSVITPANDTGQQSAIFSEADDVLNSIVYPGP